eukprot:5390546-Amphidinium_carterae.1
MGCKQGVATASCGRQARCTHDTATASCERQAGSKHDMATAGCERQAGCEHKQDARLARLMGRKQHKREKSGNQCTQAERTLSVSDRSMKKSKQEPKHKAKTMQAGMCRSRSRDANTSTMEVQEQGSRHKGKTATRRSNAQTHALLPKSNWRFKH